MSKAVPLASGPDLWQPLTNRTPAGVISYKKLKIKKECPVKGCHYRVRPAKHTEAMARVCPSSQQQPLPAVAPNIQARCGDDARAIGAAGVKLLLGVHSGPASIDRRDGIRATWLQWSRTTAALACFLLGRHGLGAQLTAMIEAEAVRHADVLWLTFNATEGARPRLTIAKAAAWWWAALPLLAPSVTHVARADDDSFVVLPSLLADLSRLGCVEQLCYGPMAYVGYNPETFTKCGWNWSGDGNYYKYRCEASGAQPPFPFPFGALQVLSVPVVRHLGHSRELRRFVQRSEEVTAAALGEQQHASSAAHVSKSARSFDQAEDAALGFWLSRAQLQRQLNLTYVDVTARAPNLACYRKRGLYQRPSTEQVALHYIKKPAGMRLLWRVLHDGVSFDADECHRITSKWGILI